MPRTRKSYAPSLKARVALEAIRGHQTAAQIAQTFDVHPNLVACWKKQALEQLPEIFVNPQAKQGADADKDELYEQIGRLKVELDFLKKELGLTTEQKRRCINPHHPELSTRGQCELLGLAPSSFYYEPKGETADTLALTRRLDNCT